MNISIQYLRFFSENIISANFFINIQNASCFEYLFDLNYLSL